MSLGAGGRGLFLDRSCGVVSVFIAVLWLVLSSVSVQADTASFEAYLAKKDNLLLVRLDSLPADLAQQPLTGVDVSLDGGPARSLLLAARPAFERTVLALPSVPGRVRQLRLRFVQQAETGPKPGAWSAPHPVTVLSRSKQAQTRLADQNWEWRAHPSQADTFQVRFSRRLSGQFAALSAIAVRVNWQDTRMVLPPDTEQWVDLPLDAVSYGRGRNFQLYVAPVAGKKRGNWSVPKAVQLEWRGEMRRPDAPWSEDWMVRATGADGEIRLEVLQAPASHQSPLTALEIRIRPVNQRFASLGPDSGWMPLTLPDPAAGGMVRLDGLDSGQRYLIELRGRSPVGAGRSSAPKMVTPRNIGLPTKAVIGDLNQPGEARIRVAAGSAIVRAPAGWKILPGDVLEGPWDWLVADRVDPEMGTVTLSSGTEIDIQRRAHSFVVETAQELERFLQLPPGVKSGSTLMIGAGWLDSGSLVAAFEGAFSDLSAPITVVPREPEAGTQLTRWWIGSRNPIKASGQLIMRDLDFVYPEAIWARDGRQRTVSIIETRHSRGAVRDLTFERVSIRSDAMPARLGYVQRSLIRAADFEQAETVKFLDGEIAHIVYGLRVGLRNSLTRGNRMHHLIADPVNINTAAGAQGYDVIIEHNTAFDFMGDGFLLHGDGTHMWVHGGRSETPARIENLKYRGNVIFPGHEGIRAPVSMTALFKLTHHDANMTLRPQQDHELIRIDASDGPVVITLPELRKTLGLIQRRDKQMVFAIQKGDSSSHPVTIVAARGEYIGRRRAGQITLTQPYEAVEFRARKTESRWQISAPVPALQGFYADPRGTELPGLEIEANIFWGLSLRQISPDNLPQQNARIHHNAILMPLPGDRDGDGHWNTRRDGVTRKAGQILVPAGDDTVSVFANIAGRTVLSETEGHQDQTWNNVDLAWDENTQQLRANFATLAELPPLRPLSNLRWFPTSRDEAIALARPAAQGSIAKSAQGPLGVTTQTDWWDFEAGRRNSQLDLSIIGKVPANGDVSPVSVPELRLVFESPIAGGGGTIDLLAEGHDQVLASWSLEAPDARVEIKGSQLILRLPRSLKTGHRYVVVAPKGAVFDHWGRSWSGVRPGGWVFGVSKDVQTNFLEHTDLSAQPWGSTGLQIAPVSGQFHTVTATARNNRLRIRIPPVEGMPRNAGLRLQFTYIQKEGQGRAVSHLNGPRPIRIDWDKIPAGEPFQVGKGIWAQRRLISPAPAGVQGSVYSAAILFSRRHAQSEIDIDLLRALQEGGQLAVGNLSLTQADFR